MQVNLVAFFKFEKNSPNISLHTQYKYASFMLTIAIVSIAVG